jgi:pimeloyl-ACP methyl ester carboxylesterase
VILLDPSLQMRPEQALQGAELGRLDWSFETPRGAINAVFAARGTGGSPPREVVSFVEESLRRDGDGRYRFDFSPGAVVAAWSEMSLPAPPVADVPTLVVTAGDTPFGPRQEERYRDRLGAGLSLVRVPNGHNVLWESPEETGLAIERFLEPGAAGGKAAIDPTPGYLDAGGSLRPLL